MIHATKSFIIPCFLVNLISCSAYECLRDQNILTLPSARSLSKISCGIDPDMSSINVKYLEKRFQSMSYYESHVHLIFDEIYVAKRLEFSRATNSGVGLSNDSVPAKTVLCFMVSSICGSYRDIVQMIPLSQISSTIIIQYLWKIIEEVTKIGFYITSISADNHSANRKAFLQLFDNNWQPSISNPFNNEPIFVLFDSTHNLKNVYNNLVNRTFFEYQTETGSSFCRMERLKKLVELENDRALKLAPHLKNRHLQPSNLDRLSTKPALAVFNEKTIAALESYSSEFCEFKETSNLLSKVLKIWHILNVKSPAIGKFKRDISRDTVKHPNDWKLDALEEFRTFLVSWQNSKFKGLTKETNHCQH